MTSPRLLAARLVRASLPLCRAAVALRRWRHGGRTPRLLAVLHGGRCGSTVLGELLDQHDQIRWGGELFFDVHRKVSGFRPTAAWIRTVIELAASRQGDGVFGFETQRVHLRYTFAAMPVAAYIELLESVGVRDFVLLQRRNLLRSVVSVLVARRTGVGHAVAAQAVQRLRIDVADPWGAGEATLAGLLEQMDRFYAEVAEALRPRRHLVLTYEEDLERDPQVGYRRVCEFLGLPPQAASARLVPTNPYPLGSLVDNLDEVAAHLRATPYAWMAGPARSTAP